MNKDPYQEKLDDPNLPFDLRWPLINEIDSTNHRFGIYKMFIRDWDKWAMKQLGKQKNFSVLEVGSGSGGLSLEIRKWAEKRGLNVTLHLYDAQEDVLTESLNKFDHQKPEIHVASKDHLKVYPNQAFDFVISLHVIHHIQPFTAAVSAMGEMMRISKKGIFVVDLENKFLAVPFAKFWNKLTGVTPDLSEDGIKSIKRSYFAEDLKNALLAANDKTHNQKLNVKKLFFVPYWRISSSQNN